MRVGVTGGTGNVGLALVERLARNPEVSGVVAVSRRRPEQLPHGVEWRPGELATGLGDALDDVDAVVHLAWLFQPSHAPGLTWRANVAGTARLLRALTRGGRVRTLVHASSVGAYSPDPGRFVDETAPTHGMGTSPYSMEKAYVEQRRLFGGPFAPGRTIGRLGLPLLPDPGVRFQVVHRRDVARAYELALTGEVRGAFNLAADPPVGVAEVAEHLGARVVTVPPRLLRTAVKAAWHAHVLPLSPGMYDLIACSPLLDTQRARQVLGWQPEHTPQEALADLVAGLASNEGAPTPPLAPETSGPLRTQEFRTGLGERP
jgi:UDP-glucose 4-epimerase